MIRVRLFEVGLHVRNLFGKIVLEIRGYRVATVDFTLEDIRRVVREEVRDEFKAAFKPAFEAAFKPAFDAAFKPAFDTAFKEAFRPAFDVAFKESFRPAFDSAFKPAFDEAIEPIASSIQRDIQRLDARLEEGFAGVNQRLRRFGQAAHELLVNGDGREH